MSRPLSIMIKYVLILFIAFPCTGQTLERQHGLPDGLLQEIERVESPFGTGTKFAIDVTSGKQWKALHEIAKRIGRPAHRIRSNYCGAIGVMQIKPATFLEFARYGADPENPRDNRETAARYLGWLVKRYGLEKALVKYSGGARYVPKVLEKVTQK